MDTRSRIDIEWQCIGLNRQFAFYEDAIREQGVPEKIAALFTPDGVLEEPGRLIRGRDEIVAWAQWGKDLADTYVSRHIIPNFCFSHVDETSATAVVYNITYQGRGEPGKPAEIVYLKPQGYLLRLQMEYRNTPDGWRIALLKVDSIFHPIDDVQAVGVWRDASET